MGTVETWQSRPVFVTSTFQDMQAERDHLLTLVFPALEEWLATRRRHLEWIDLRVGVSSATEGETSRELKILKVCLEEVRRSRPFVVGLLGDRYGWVPPIGRIESAAAEAGFEGDVAGRSVTDLEIEFGVLHDLGQSRRSLVFLRAPLPVDEMSPLLAAVYSDRKAVDPEAAARATRLVELKARLRHAIPERCFDYEVAWDRRAERVTGLESWGRMVEARLRAAFEDEFAGDAAPAQLTWHEAETEALDDFIEDRARGFVGRTETIERIQAILLSASHGGGQWGVCVTGDAGSGKTALFGEIYRRLRALEVLALAHAPGATTQGPWIGFMLRRFIAELIGQPDAAHLFRYTSEGEIIEKNLLDAALSSEATEEDLYPVLSLLLARMAERRRVVMLVDALDQIDPNSRGRFTNWVRNDWPPGAGLLTTTIAGDASVALSEDPGIELLRLPPLDEAEARAIAGGICSRYHRQLEPIAMNALAAKRGLAGPAWGIPLGLTLAVEELNLLDADDFARAKRDYQGRDDERLTGLMCDLIRDMPADVRGMYQSGIARAEATFGRQLVCAFLGTIALSTAGWREGDFRELLPMLSGRSWDELQFASLRRLFRGQLRLHKPLGRWNFVHSQMRVAARDWLADIGVDERSVHTAIVNHLLALPAEDPVRISEVMLHLMESEDWARAATYLVDVENDKAANGGALHVLVDALKAPTEHTSEDTAHRLSFLLDAEGINDAMRHRVASRLLEVHYGSQGRCSLAAQEIALVAVENCLRRLVEKLPSDVGVLEQHARALTWLGHLRKDQDDLEGALTSHRGAQAIRERIATLQPEGADKRKRDPGNTLAIGDALLARGDVEGALATYRHPANLKESAGHNRIGVVLRMKGDFKGALASFRTGMAILMRELERDPRNQPLRLSLGIAHSTIGTTLVAAGDLKNALISYRTGMEIVSRVAALNPTEPHVQSEWALMHYRIADVLRREADLDGALAWLGRGRPILERVVAQYPDNPHFTQHLTLFESTIVDLSRERKRDEDVSESPRLGFPGGGWVAGALSRWKRRK